MNNYEAAALEAANREARASGFMGSNSEPIGSLKKSTNDSKVKSTGNISKRELVELEEVNRIEKSESKTIKQTPNNNVEVTPEETATDNGKCI